MEGLHGHVARSICAATRTRAPTCTVSRAATRDARARAFNAPTSRASRKQLTHRRAAAADCASAACGRHHSLARQRAGEAIDAARSRASSTAAARRRANATSGEIGHHTQPAPLVPRRAPCAVRRAAARTHTTTHAHASPNHSQQQAADFTGQQPRTRHAPRSRAGSAALPCSSPRRLHARRRGSRVAGLMYIGSQNANRRVNVNTNARRPPGTPSNANANAGKKVEGPEVSTALGRAEQKIVSGSTLTREDLAALSPEELRVLRNAVFARYGRTFQDAALQEYFASRPWYKPRADFNEKMLTAGDRANADIIKAFESGGPRPRPSTRLPCGGGGGLSTVWSHDDRKILRHIASTRRLSTPTPQADVPANRCTTTAPAPLPLLRYELLTLRDQSRPSAWRPASSQAGLLGRLQGRDRSVRHSSPLKPATLAIVGERITGALPETSGVLGGSRPEEAYDSEKRA